MGPMTEGKNRIDRLLGVEQQARGVEGFGVSGAWDPHGLLALAADLKLPKFEADGNRYQYSWPPPQPNLALQMIRPDPFIVSEAAKGTYIKQRNRRIMEDPGDRSPRPSSGSASSRSRRPPRLRPPRSVTGRLIASAGGRADNSLG